MNTKMTLNIIAKMLGVEGLLMWIPAFVSFYYHEQGGYTFILVSLVLFAIYFLFGRKEPEDKTIYFKEGLFIVGMAWILYSLFGAIPFVMSGAIPSYLDAFFETVSGFTTTGSSILTDIEALPKGMLFWRSLTHWVGGMGVLVFVMSLMNLDNENSMFLMRAEMPGPETDKLVSKSRNTARILYFIYLILTVAEVIFLKFGGMTLYDAVLHTFSTAGTGGFSSKNNSIAYFNSPYIDGVITVFMILFGVNFNLYFLVYLRKWKDILKNEELHVYLGVIVTAITLVSINIFSLYGNLAETLRYSSFQVAAIITTTGFCTADFASWPMFASAVIMGLMVIGACAGSTGGGMKVSRIIILFKSIGQEIKQMLHPKSVSVVKVNGKPISDRTKQNVYVYFICYVFILIGSVMIVSLDNFDFTTTFSSVLTTLNNVGPGFSMVGPTGNFFGFSNLSKVVLCLDMLIGRLEIFPYLLLFSPAFWRRKF